MNHRTFAQLPARYEECDGGSMNYSAGTRITVPPFPARRAVQERCEAT
jgi:hypothetical protein